MTKTNDMGHLDHLAAVANADVKHVLGREATYKGSWKKSGGRSAWFMLKRKIDRLLVMMARPEAPAHFRMVNVTDTLHAIANEQRLPGAPGATVEMLGHLQDCYRSEDVFLKIAEDPTGRDGTPYAELCDLAQYILLVRAEMVNQGVVVLPKSTVQLVETNAVLDIDVPDGKRFTFRVGESWDPYQKIATLTGLERSEVENAVAKLMAEQLRELWEKDPEKDDFYTGVSKDTGIPRDALKGALMAFTAANDQGPKVGKERLEDGVEEKDCLPTALYIHVKDPIENRTYWNVDRRHLPRKAFDHLRRLRTELNNKEWTDSLPEYRGMYYWNENQSKWVLSDAWVMSWGQEH